MRIKILVRQPDAIRRGEVEHGETAVTIDDWSGWSDAERADLAARVANRDSLDLGVAPNAEELHKEIARRVADRAASEGKLAAEREKKIALRKEIAARLPDLMRARVAADGPSCLYREGWSTRSIEGLVWSGLDQLPTVSPSSPEDPAAISIIGGRIFVPLPPDLQAAADAERARQDAERKSRAAEQKAAEEQRERDKAERAAAATAEWARLFEVAADDGDKRQRAAGLMSDELMMGVVREFMFAPLVEWSRFDLLDSNDVDHADDCTADDGDEVSFDVSDAETLTRREFVTFETATGQAKVALGDRTDGEVTCTVRRHVARCTSCNEIAKRSGLLVTVTSGPVTLTREFAFYAGGTIES